MKEGWTTRWKAFLIWLSGYLSIVAFAIAGGYAIVKSDDEELKKTAKQALIVTLIFTAISVFLSLYNTIGGMTDNYYLSKAYEAYEVMHDLMTIAKIVVFVAFAAFSFFKGGAVVGGSAEKVKVEAAKPAAEQDAAEKKEEQNSENR